MTALTGTAIISRGTRHLLATMDLILSFTMKEVLQTSGSGYLWGGHWGPGLQEIATLGYSGLSCKVFTFDRKGVFMSSCIACVAERLP